MEVSVKAAKRAERRNSFTGNMKKSVAKLIRKEAIRFAKVEEWPDSDVPDVFEHIKSTYLGLTRNKRGKFRMELEKVNHVGQFS